MDNALLSSDSFCVRMILDTYTLRTIYDVKLVGERKPSYFSSPNFFVCEIRNYTGKGIIFCS